MTFCSQKETLTCLRVRALSHVLALVAVMVLTACTAGQRPTAPASPDLHSTTEAPVIGDTTGLTMPLDTYLLPLSDEQQRSVVRRELLIGCMQRFGIRLVIPEPPTDVGPRTRNERRYGVSDPVAAKAVGYGLGNRDPRLRKGGRDEAPTLTARARAVLTGLGSTRPAGVPEGGCSGEVARLLTPVDPGTEKALDEDLPEALSFISFSGSQSDPRVQAAFADWASCMRARGHSYASPLEPPADARFSPPGGAAERATAEDDVTCKDRTNLVGRWYAVESAQQALLIDEHKNELENLRVAESKVSRFVRSVSTPR